MSAGTLVQTLQMVAMPVPCPSGHGRGPQNSTSVCYTYTVIISVIIKRTLCHEASYFFLPQDFAGSCETYSIEGRACGQFVTELIIQKSLYSGQFLTDLSAFFYLILSKGLFSGQLNSKC